MLRTVEAEIYMDGTVRLLEALPVTKPSRALVTLLEMQNGHPNKGNAADVLSFLRENRLPEQARSSMEEMEARILEARESWD